jgi:phosphoglycolate phosphatase-like HAD superfamily hydrolase
LRKLILAAVGTLVLLGTSGCGQDPLPSWNDGAAKQSILQFVKKVTDRSGPNFVAPADRVAAFDNDGTLWVEQPLYVYVLFAADQMKALAPKHPEWSANAAFQTVINGPADAILTLPPADQFAVAFAVHSGMTTEEYSNSAREWLATHKHPRFQRPYTELTYQPMLQLIAYLRANEFQVYSVTGSEIDFVRVVNEQAFGVARDHVIATVLKNKFDGTAKPAELFNLPDVLMIDDGDGKPISIHNAIGRRPIAAFGNSDGDLSMLQWTAAGPGARLAVLVHHDDAAREFAYDRNSAVGKLDKALDAAQAQGWTVVSMKGDWRDVFRQAGMPR